MSVGCGSTRRMPWFGLRFSGSIAVSCVVFFGLLACHAEPSGSRPSRNAAEPNETYPMRWVTYSRQPMGDRQAAIERMLEKDARGFWADCAALTRQIDDWPMIRLLSEKAAASRSADALPWLVRSWAMPSKLVTDDDRPERAAIESITGKPADHLLEIIVFAGMEEDEPATQIAAWSVLVRTESHERLRHLIAEVPEQGQHLLVSALKRVAPAVDVLPSDRLAIAQMMRLSVAHADPQWQAWARWRQSHLDDGPATLALRHLPALEHRDPQRADWMRQRWLTHIEHRLVGRRHATRGDGADDDIVVKLRPDRLADHAEALGVADLIVLEQLLDAMDDPVFRAVAFEQAEADRLDTTTEFGGALVWGEQGKLVLKPFTPLMRRHDQAYIASTPCLEAVYMGLAHVHFHTQRFDNAAWAGPGKGDLDFVESHHVNAIVFTYLDRNTLNLDVALPGGIIIDMGCVTR